MVKWEYCAITWTVRKVSDEERVNVQDVVPAGSFHEDDDGTVFLRIAQIYFMNDSGDGEAKEQFTSLNAAMRKLGLDGWELVSHTESSRLPGSEMFYFKRPIEVD